MSPHNKRPNSNMVGSTSSSLFSTSSSATLNATMPSTSTNTNTKSFSVATVAATSAAAAFVASNAISSTETTFCEENNDMTNTMPFPEEAIIADTYNGVTVDVSDLPSHLSTCPIAFEKALTQALIIWEQEGKRGIWLKLSKQFANLIPSTIEQGFDFQLAEKGRVILTKWLPQDTPSRLPLGPTHQVGIGALLLHPTDPRKMLVVQEKTGPAAKYGLWKMPTGLSDPGEDIYEAAIREMKEETGLHCVFHKIVCFRQAHSVGSYGKSDMFFVCLMGLDPTKYDLEMLQKGVKEVPLEPQEEEIACIDWMDMNSFTEQGLWVDSPLYSTMNKAMLEVVKEAQESESKKLESDGDTAQAKKGFIAKTLPIGYRKGDNTLYLSNL